MKKIFLLLGLGVFALQENTQAQKNIGGYKLDYSMASTIQEIIFCPNKTVFSEDNAGFYAIGKWRSNDNEIRIEWNPKQLLHQGGGEYHFPGAVSAGGTNWQDYDYAYFTKENVTDREEVIEWDFVNDRGLKALSKEELKNYCSVPLTLNGDYPAASLTLLTNLDLKNLNKKELQIMRNEIFARHGLTFQTDAMKKHFGKQSWYSAKYKDVNDKLTPIETANIELIKKFEAKAK